MTALLPPARIRVPLGSHSRHALLRELVELALPDAAPETVESVFQAVLAREAAVSTAMGDGLAVPHGRTDAVSTLSMAAGVASGVDDYEAPDGQPVRLCFLVLTPRAEAGQHLKVLSRVARLVRSEEMKNALIQARDADEFHAVLQRAEVA